MLSLTFSSIYCRRKVIHNQWLEPQRSDQGTDTKFSLGSQLAREVSVLHRETLSVQNGSSVELDVRAFQNHVYVNGRFVFSSESMIVTECHMSCT